MPDDLSWLTEEVNENILRENNVPRVEIWLNGERYVRELVAGKPLDASECHITTQRRLWCMVFGHRDPAPSDVYYVTTCHCGALAACVADGWPAARYVHLGRCIRCNAAHLPRARLVR